MKRLPPASRRKQAAQGIRRVWPYVLMAWERWQALSPEEKERYKRRAREYAERGRSAAQQARSRLPQRGRRR